LVETSCLLRADHLNGRNIHGSKQDSRRVELECAYECQRHLEFSWIGKLLLVVYRRILENNQAHDHVAREGQEVQVNAHLGSWFQGVEERTNDLSGVSDA
jgi:hypothetical protein